MRLISGPNTRIMAGNSAAITQTGAIVSCVTAPAQATAKLQNSYNCNPSFDSGHKRSTHLADTANERCTQLPERYRQ
jgi:hypothetical protein